MRKIGGSTVVKVNNTGLRGVRKKEGNQKGVTQTQRNSKRTRLQGENQEGRLRQKRASLASNLPEEGLGERGRFDSSAGSEVKPTDAHRQGRQRKSTKKGESSPFFYPTSIFGGGQT